MPNFVGTILVLVLVLFILMIIASCIKIVPQAQALVIERLGAYMGTWGVGIHFKAPFIDRVAKRVTPPSARYIDIRLHMVLLLRRHIQMATSDEIHNFSARLHALSHIHESG